MRPRPARTTRTCRGTRWLLACAMLAAAVAADAQPDNAAAVRELLQRGNAQGALQRIDGIAARAPGAPAPSASSAPSAPSATLGAELRFLRGVALMDLGRDAEALGWFEAMAQDHPELPDPWNNIALLHVRGGRLDSARLALETALRNDPSYRVARANLGLVHLMLALRAWEELASTGPVDATLTRRLEGARGLLAR